MKIKIIILLYIIIFHIKVNVKLKYINEFLYNGIDKMSLVIPIIAKDFYKIIYNYKFYINFIEGISKKKIKLYSHKMSILIR